VSDTSLQHFRSDALSSLFYVANWHFAFTGQSYFDQFAGPSPLRHMWSLAIEEQFYLLWPLILYVGLRAIRLRPPYRVGRLLKLQRQVLAGAALIGTCASAGLMALLYSPGRDPSRIYYGTDTRAQAILAGAFLAFVLVDTDRERLRHPLVQAAGALGLAGSFAMFRLVSDTSGYMYAGGFLLMAVFGGLAITAAVGPTDTPFARALSWHPLTWLGTLSYGIYLWHWPIFVFLDSDRTSLSGTGLLLLRLLVTLGVASASYYFVEAPIRFGALRRPRPRALVLGAAIACLAVLAFGFASVRSPATTAAAAEPVVGTSQGAPLRILFVGDSVGVSLSNFYRPPPGTQPYSIKTDALLGCALGAGTSPVVRQRALHPPGCDRQSTTWSQDVAATRPDLAIMLYGPWELGDVSVYNKVVKFGTAGFRQMLLDQLDSARKILTLEGARMVILNIPCFKALDSVEGFPQAISQPNRSEWVNGVYRDYGAQHPEVSVIDLHRFVCPTGKFSGTVNGVRYTDDGIHFNVAGAPVVWSWLRPQLSKISSRQ